MKLDQRTEVVEEPDPRGAATNLLPRPEVFKRIEEDRERHKRLRERRWVQPISHTPQSALPPPLACFLPLTDDGDGAQELTLDIEFDNDWETTSDWNEDDDEAAVEENELCFPGYQPHGSHSRGGSQFHGSDGEESMDLS